MPQAITSLLPLLTTGTQLASGASGLYQGYENQKYQDLLRSYAQNPTKLNAYAQQFVQPLNAGLEKGVGNEAQAYAAERGLAQSPGPQQDIIAQAIAPYIQQNQQTGYQDALTALGLGGGAQSSNPAASLTSLFSGLSGAGGLAQLQSLKSLSSNAGPVQPIDESGSITSLIPQQGMQDFYSTFTNPYQGS